MRNKRVVMKSQSSASSSGSRQVNSEKPNRVKSSEVAKKKQTLYEQAEARNEQQITQSVVEKTIENNKIDYTKVENLPEIMDVSHLCAYLNIKRNSGYDLVKTKGFPAIRIGPKLIRIPKEDFLVWIENKKQEALCG